MKYIPLFPIKIGGDKLGSSNKDLEKYKNFILTQKLSYFKENNAVTISQQILNEGIFGKITKQILNYSKVFIEEFMSQICEEVQLASSWGYVTTSNNESDNFHLHQNSYVSGVYYLTNGSPLIFQDPNIKYSYYGFYNRNINIPDPYQSSVPIEKDLLILFPSYLPHSVGVFEDSKPRVSIAFNIIPKGKFGGPTAEINL